MKRALMSDESGLHALQKLRDVHTEAFGELEQRREPRVKIAPLDLLIVGQRPVVIAHQIHLGHPFGRAHLADAASQAFLGRRFRGHHCLRRVTVDAHLFPPYVTLDVGRPPTRPWAKGGFPSILGKLCGERQRPSSAAHNPNCGRTS